MDDINMGPTVAEYAQDRVNELNHEIIELENERTRMRLLYYKFADSQMLYSEYVASKSEPYQRPQYIGGTTNANR